MQEQNKRFKKPINQVSLFEQGKIPPQATDLEEAVLGAIMLESDALIKIMHILKENMFYKDIHQKIFKAINNLFEENNPVDILTVTHQLKKNNDLELVGGAYYITLLTSRIASSANIHYHAMIIKQKYLQRELIRISSEIIKDAFEDSCDVFDIYDKLLEEIKSLGMSREETESHEELDETVSNMFSEMEEGAKEEAINVYPSRSPFMTKMFKYSPGNIILFAGKSSSGKTTIMTDEVFGIVENNPDNVSVLWYSMEDIPKNIIRQYIGSKMKLTVAQLSNMDYKMSKEEIEIAKSYQHELSSYDITFKKGSTHIKTIKNSFHQWKLKLMEKHKGKKHLYMLVIDNIKQLLDNGQMNLFKNQTAIDDYIAATYKSIYMDNQEDTLIWVLHHLGKEQIMAKGATNAYRPIESDLKGSESYPAVCTQVALINRPGEFPDLLREYKDDDRYETLKRLIIIECVKNRIGGTKGIVYRLGSNVRYLDDLQIIINN